MHPIIKNLALIADAAEYFDKRLGSAWRIRSALENTAIWSANALIHARKANDKARIVQAAATLGTVRSWIRECNTTSFAIHLTPAIVAKVMRVDDDMDVHGEACKIARNQCMRARSAADFKRYYDKARAMLEDRIADKSEVSEQIVALLQEDHFIDPDGGQRITDLEIYDDDTAEKELERLTERVGKVLDLLEVTCNQELEEAITSGKRDRLLTYQNDIRAMMEIVGIDQSGVAARQARLEASINAQMQDVSGRESD